MGEVVLRESTGDPAADRIVRGVVGIFEQAFCGRVVGYYLRGSYASGTRGEGSDLDLFVVFTGRLDPEEARRANQLAGHCALLSPILLEILVVSQRQLAREDNLPIALNLKLATRLLYGMDIRPGLPEFDGDTYQRLMAHAPYLTYAYPRDDPVLTCPLDHIDPDGEFFGFDRLAVPGPEGSDIASTKLLVATVCWTATALVALAAGAYVPDKAAAVELYGEHVADEWTGFVVQVYDRCRSRWHYRIPTGEAERRDLRAMCEQALAFQNQFLSRYREFQLGELRSGVPGRQALAARHLGQIRFADPEVIAALHAAGFPG